ncbi:hypothetical protein GOP47_0024449 [Adiantum capillus-veneris]|uniref:Uncharacterized protein n=1 Tax=Adiantum capillus-veneris TaxID=13818 RepID=A0A9D4U438_ADICA|nr:hypothetical protein GOP47_0024449 [Adiantum capillus-veneris]
MDEGNSIPCPGGLMLPIEQWWLSNSLSFVRSSKVSLDAYHLHLRYTIHTFLLFFCDSRCSDHMKGAQKASQRIQGCASCTSTWTFQNCKKIGDVAYKLELFGRCQVRFIAPNSPVETCCTPYVLGLSDSISSSHKACIAALEGAHALADDLVITES